MQPTLDYIKASDGVANASLMTISTVRAPLATTILVNTVANVPTNFLGSMGTPNTFTDPITGETITVISEATAVDFAGHVDGSNIEIDEIAPGYTDNGSAVGDIIIIRPTTQWADLLAQYLTPTGMISPFAGSTAPDNWLICNGASLDRTAYPRLFDIIGTTYGAVDGSHFNVPDLRDRTPVGSGQSTYVDTQPAASYNVSNVITVADNDSLHTGQAVVLTTSGSAPGGLTAGVTYYVIRLSSTTISLATSRANAVAGTVIDITSTGSGNHTLTLTLTSRALGAKGGEEAHSLTTSEVPSHNHLSAVAAFKGVVVQTGGGASAMWGGNAMTAPSDGVPANTSSTGGSTSHNNMQPYLALNYIIKT